MKFLLSLHIELQKMKIRNRALLDKFVKKHADSVKAMQRFIDIVEEAEWQNLTDIKNDFNSVDYITNERYVFDIKGNKYRIIVVIILLEVFFRYALQALMLNTIK